MHQCESNWRQTDIFEERGSGIFITDSHHMGIAWENMMLASAQLGEICSSGPFSIEMSQPWFALHLTRKRSRGISPRFDRARNGILLEDDQPLFEYARSCGERAS